MGPGESRQADSQPLSAEEIAGLQRRMRLETWSGLAIMITLALGAAGVVILNSAGLRNLVLPMALVVAVVTIGATVTWVVGHYRAERAFARIDSEPRRRQPLWRYGIVVGAALIAGATYALLPQYGRWIWYGVLAAGAVGFVWAQFRRRRTSSRK